MDKSTLRKLWTIYRGAKSREGLVGTLVLAFDVQMPLMEKQCIVIQNYLIDLWDLPPDEAAQRVQGSIAQIAAWGPTRSIARIASRFASNAPKNKEKVLRLFLAPHLAEPIAEEMPPSDQERFLAFGKALRAEAIAERVLRQAVRFQRRACGLPIEVGNSYEEGGLLYEDGELELALTALSAALQQAPNHADALRLRSIIHLKLEQPELAQADAQVVLRLVPDDPQAHYILAQLAARRDDIDTLLPHLRQALDGDRERFMDHVLSDVDFDTVREHPHLHRLLVQRHILPRSVGAEVHLPQAVCGHCRTRGAVYRRRIRYKRVKMDFYRCTECGDTHPSAVFGKDVLVWHSRRCPKCGQRGIYYLGSDGNPSITGGGDVCHYYRCAHPECRYAWRKSV